MLLKLFIILSKFKNFLKNSFNDWKRDEIYWFYFIRKKLLRFYWFIKAKLVLYTKQIYARIKLAKYEISMGRATISNFRFMLKKHKNRKSWQPRGLLFFYHFRFVIWVITMFVVFGFFIMLSVILFLYFHWDY